MAAFIVQPPAYRTRRRTLGDAVVSAVTAAGPGLTLAGSFRFGDFHLDADADVAHSLSDVDLVADGAGDEARALMARKVEEGLAERVGMRLRVSVHPGAKFAALSPADARFLAIGEYLRHRDDGPGTLYHDFLLAKVTLLVLREHQGERYLEVAGRLATDEAALAARIKLGVAHGGFLPAARTLLGRAPYPEARLLAERFLPRADAAEVRAYTRELRRRPGIDPWLREYVAGKVDAAATPLR
ncbi:hypothetical protein GCM10023191_083510 [Actinoallomurus oryzae]|uniref:Nucleotidyl transferase AbiEii toxin, Type IV TA system n=1 Tax=Actinoallomurus oryzae TaxID=502180 RepID=A0ABP8R030_9ACTN